MARFRRSNPIRDHIGVIAALAIILVGLSAVLFFRNAPHLGNNSEEQSILNSEYESELTASQTPDSYLLPTDTKYITNSDLDRFTEDEIIFIRNELYARHGYDFEDETIRAYFDAKSWYEPIPGLNASTFNASVFNGYEAANIALILAYEEKKQTSDMTPPASAQEEMLTDHLTSKEDVKNYAFEMHESGDAVIMVTGLQEAWDGYTYHWRCTIYRDDPAQAIAQADVRGYSVNYGPTIISVPKLDAGTYYIQMASTSSANPFMTAFTTESYMIRLISYFYSAVPAYDSDELQTFQNANDVLWASGGTGFLKLNDGECFGVLMKNRNGAFVPVLISTSEAAVEYMISSTGKIITAQGPLHSEELGVDYYYSGCDNISQYLEKPTDTSSFPMQYVDASDARSATEEIMNMQEDEKYKAEHGEVKFWLKKNKGALIAGAIFGALVLLGLFSNGDGYTSSGPVGPDSTPFSDFMDWLNRDM